MGNQQVTIRVNPRAAYAFVAIVAAVAVVAIAFVVSQRLAGTPSVPDAPAPASNTEITPASQNAALTSSDAQVQTGASDDTSSGPPVGGGVSPVSVEEQPIDSGQPRLWIDELDPAKGYAFDMGDIPGEGPSEHTFTMRNIGEGELVITGTGASCGCTVAVVDNDHLQPGEATTVRVRYDPNVNGDQGKFIQKQIRITSNDPVTPNVEFTIEGQVASQ